MDHAELSDILDYIGAELSEIRRAIAASDHAGAMFSIDCLIGAAAEQTRCKLAGLEHAGMPVARDAPGGESGAAAHVQAGAARPDVGKAARRVRRLP